MATTAAAATWCDLDATTTNPAITRTRAGTRSNDTLDDRSRLSTATAVMLAP